MIFINACFINLSCLFYTGCVDFMVSYEVDTGSGVRDFRTLTSVDDIQKQSEELRVVWLDGDRLDVTVRAVYIQQNTR